MREIKEKRKWRMRLFSRITIAGLLFFLLFIAHATWGVFGKFLETQRNKIRAQENVAELLKREAVLVGEIEYLKTTRGVEEEIRENFGFAKEGEGVVIIVRDKGRDTSEKTSQGGFWTRIQRFFLRE
ncbi:MAG: septum formation initiator family protein [Candidatus Paceibacterota bacterium]